MYEILPYTYQKAKENGLHIQHSHNVKKKIDVVFPEHVVSIGAMGYGDYPTFLKTHGKEYADKRRIAYYKRHAKDTGIAGELAKLLLW